MLRGDILYSLRGSVMAKAKFKIENKQDHWAARSWIKGKLEGFSFPVSDSIENSTSKNMEAEKDFNQMNDNAEQLNQWCETYLDSKQWTKLKNAIRAARMRLDRKKNYDKSIKRIDITNQARYMLKELSKHHGVTYSGVIEMYLKKPFMDLDKD